MIRVIISTGLVATRKIPLNPEAVTGSIIERNTCVFRFNRSSLVSPCFWARLRYLLGEYLGVDPRNIHAYVMGEHGDSEFVPWSQAFLATKSISQLDWELESSLTAHLLRIEEEVRTAAYKIIEAKKSTYYGIGMALTRITKAILGDEHSVLTVSAMLRGEYDQMDVFAGVPCIINQNGVQRILPLSLTDEEKEKFNGSCDILREGYEGIL